MRVWRFCDGSNKDETAKQAGCEGHMRVSVSFIIPWWERLVAAKQAQGSH